MNAFSQSDEELDKLYGQINIAKNKIAKEFVVCKPLPNDPNSVIYVIPEKTSDQEEFCWTGDIHLLKTDSKSGKVVVHSILENAIESDAIRLYKIWIDTVPYFISENKRAFAIRLKYANNSRAAGYDSEESMLFEEKNNNFIKILGLVTFKSLSYDGGECENSELRNQRSTIIIDKKNSNKNYFNIFEKIHYEHYFLNKDCEEGKKETKDFTNIYYYSDSTYICKGEPKEGF